jgi:hypothetical protein
VIKQEENQGIKAGKQVGVAYYKQLVGWNDWQSSCPIPTLASKSNRVCGNGLVAFHPRVPAEMPAS